MKTGNVHFMQVTRSIWDYDLSDNAKMLFFWLNELEQRYTNSKTNYFFRSDEDLSKDLGWCLKTLKNAKAELKKTDLIKCGKVHWWQDQEHTKLSKKYTTTYTILK